MTAAEFNNIWLPLGTPLYRVALYLLGDPQDAEDAVQDLMLKLWNSGDSLPQISSPRAYAVMMMRNLCLDRIKAASRKPLERITDDLPVTGSQEDQFGNRQRLDKVLKDIESLPDRQRRALRMKVLEELSYKEIAERMGTSELNVRVLVSTARKKIKEILNKNEKD